MICESTGVLVEELTWKLLFFYVLLLPTSVFLFRSLLEFLSETLVRLHTHVQHNNHIKHYIMQMSNVYQCVIDVRGGQ